MRYPLHATLCFLELQKNCHIFRFIYNTVDKAHLIHPDLLINVHMECPGFEATFCAFHYESLDPVA